MGGPGAPRSLEEAADTLVWLATLPADGPNGGFFRDREPIPWWPVANVQWAGSSQNAYKEEVAWQADGEGASDGIWIRLPQTQTS